MGDSQVLVVGGGGGVQGKDEKNTWLRIVW